MNKCKNCKKEINEKKKFCSRECYHSHNHKIIKCKFCGNEFKVIKSSKKQYCDNQCAANALSSVRRESAKKTLLKKYGVTHQSKLKSVKEKIKKKRENGSYDNVTKNMKRTKLEKYGDENYNNTEKNKKTKLENYGDENYNNREKFKNTMLDIYGHVYPPGHIERVKELSSNGIIGFKSDKFKQFLIDNNVNNVSQLPSIKKKVRTRIFENMYTKLLNSNRLGKYIEPLFTLDEYDGSNKGRQQKYKFKCKKCNTIFEDSLYSGHIPRCKVCNPDLRFISYMEKEILDDIKLIYGGTIIENDRIILNGKEVDIYIPDKKIAIEFNGLYWHSELQGKDKNYHLNKTKKCEEHGIQLIHIFEDEWINKQEIVKQRLKHILGEDTEEVIYARKCKIKEILPEEKNIFLDQYHIQGNDKSAIKLGLFNGEKLIAVMTFGKRRIALGNKSTEEGEYELIRYATSQSVVGGAGKLLSYFIKNYNPVKIISYADRRWSRGNLYEKLGFNKVSDGTPNYWYLDHGNRKHRFNFRKNILNEKLETFDSELTEWENMQLNGYDRIWDCGSLKYEWEK